MKKKYDDGGPVASAKADTPSTPNAPSFAGRVSAGKSPDVANSGSNQITGRIKASDYKKGGAVKKRR